MVKSFKKLHEDALFSRYIPEITCHRCGGDSITLVLSNDNRYRIICKKCSR